MLCLRRAGAEWPVVFSLQRMGTLLISAVLISACIAQSGFADEPTLYEPAINPDLQPLVATLETLRAEVQNSTQTLGAYNEELLGSLNSLTEALVSAQAWQEAATMVEQQIQILRINDGLYTEAQIPLIEKQLGILAAREDWITLQDRLDYLTFLLDRNQEQIPAETRLAQYKQVRDWTRLLLTRGPQSMEARYVLQLQVIEDAALQLAQDELHDPDIRQALIYDRALAELYMALGIMGSSDTRSQLINRLNGPRPLSERRLSSLTGLNDIESAYGPATSTVIERAHRTSMSRHQSMIASLASVYGETNPNTALATLEQDDPEQAAMIKLFIGDSVLLRQQYEMRIGSHIGQSRGNGSTGSAARYYQEAWQLLLKAGYNNEQLNEWFACPTLLPLDQFSKRLQTLQQNCQVAADDSVSIAATAVVRNGIPGLRYDQLPDSELISAAEGVAAQLRFAVGVNGQADRIEILSGTPESTSTRIRGKQALETLQFRPALRDGRAQRTTGITMTIYSLAPG